MRQRDGHVRLLPLHVANKIAAGEVVERPASVVKELVENAIDAGSQQIAITVTQGGRKLIAVRDDGCGMTKDDAILSLERQATSKILDVDDIEQIDTLGFRGEAIPSIAAVSRFTLATRRADSDEGTELIVNAGTLAEVRTVGCPVGTLVEVRDLFCNVPARKKFLRSYVTEENHVRNIFTQHALAHPEIGFSLTVDGRELYRLAPAADLGERVLELFGREFLDSCLLLTSEEDDEVKVHGFIERPNQFTPTRKDQYVFVNGRPATSPSIQSAIREAYPRQTGDVRPAAVLLVEVSPAQVDVNVHPTKREVRFRDNVAIRSAVMRSIDKALAGARPSSTPIIASSSAYTSVATPISEPTQSSTHVSTSFASEIAPAAVTPPPSVTPTPVPTEMELPVVSTDEQSAKPWQWFRFLAVTDSGYLLIETDSGLVTINPLAARERIAFEKLMDCERHNEVPSGFSQTLLIPEIIQLSPVDCSRVLDAADTIRKMGFQLDEFGSNTIKIDAVPQLIGSMPPGNVISTIARDLSDCGSGRGNKWREELIAKSIARSFAGSAMPLTAESATRLVEELCTCRMPYICPRSKPVMIFTSTRELERKFDRV